ncbi:hypothetical protein [Borrelia persica]|uniref:hypothetical protein n=1 Tax=Borrelia persica TaxID=44448 RepID=UPI0004B39FF6|nr:hypothetical protein [Borrelia persica]
MDDLGEKIVAIPNADTKEVEAVVRGSSAVIEKLIDSVTRLCSSTSISISSSYS